MRWKRFVPFLICWVAVSGIHAIALWNHATEDVTLDFARGGLQSPFVTSEHGWQATASGLVPVEAQPSLLIGSWKSRFENLYLDVSPTSLAMGHVKVLVTVPQDTGGFRGELPKVDLRDVPWQLHFGRPFENLDASGLVVAGQPINLARFAPEDTICRIEIFVADAPAVPVLHAVTIRRELWNWSLLLVPLYTAVLIGATFYVAGCLRGRVYWQRLVGVLLLAHVTASCLFPMELLIWSGFTIAILVAATLMMRCMGLDHRLNFGLLVLVLTFLGADLRLTELNAARFRDLDPDAAGFSQIADQSSWFYDSGLREPLFIGLVKISQTMIGDRSVAVRIVSLVCSVLLIPVLYRTGRELQGPAAGLIAAALIAASPNWVSQAARGLRLEAFTLAMLLLTSAVLTQRKLSISRQSIWMGVSATAVCLLRITSVWFCVIAIAYGFYRRGWRTLPFAITVLALCAAVSPFLIQCAVNYGDPFYAVNHHVKFYRNHEFHDQPGMPTSEEIESDPYAGPPTSSFEYFFGMHSAQELARRMVVNLHRMLLGEWLYELVCDKLLFLYWWALMAYVFVAFDRNRALLVWILLVIGPIPWLYSADYGPEWRLIFHVSALVYLCMGISVDRLMGERESLESGVRKDDSAPGR